jgi:hypothetical protein
VFRENCRLLESNHIVEKPARISKCPRNGVIGKLPSRLRQPNELTENPTFQAVRQTGLFGLSSRPIRQADFQILTPGKRKPCGALLLNRAQDPAGISDCEHVVWKIPRDYASSTYDCTRSDLDARKDNRS